MGGQLSPPICGLCWAPSGQRAPPSPPPKSPPFSLLRLKVSARCQSCSPVPLGALQAAVLLSGFCSPLTY